MDDSKALDPWRSEASQKRQAASQGVGDSKAWGPWSKASQKGQSAQQKRTATSYQSTPPKKAPRVDLTQACVMDIPHHVRGHAVPVSKKAERAKDPPRPSRSATQAMGVVSAQSTGHRRLRHVTAGCHSP